MRNQNNVLFFKCNGNNITNSRCTGSLKDLLMHEPSPFFNCFSLTSRPFYMRKSVRKNSFLSKNIRSIIIVQNVSIYLQYQKVSYQNQISKHEICDHVFTIISQLYSSFPTFVLVFDANAIKIASFW